MAKREMGHKLLARLGKTKLRPGGIEGTDWLLAHVDFDKDTRVLEVACNRGYTLMQLAQTYGLHAVGIDADGDVIDQARKNVAAEGLDDLVGVCEGTATKLPFEDGSFDVVINEAMLTMLPDATKEQALAEYRRVLVPGGTVLTHDVMLDRENDNVIRMLQKVINVPSQPLTRAGWEAAFERAGLVVADVKTGAFTLLSDEGLARDEGVEGRDQLYQNALADDNFAQFSEMKTFFDLAKGDISYIVVVGTRP